MVRWQARRHAAGEPGGAPGAAGAGALAATAAALVLALWAALPARATEAAQPGMPQPTASQEALPSGTLELELLPRASASGPVVRLGDVARPVAGERALFEAIASVPVGTAPLPGDVRVLSRGQVEWRLRQARAVEPGRIRWASGPELVEVQSAGEPVSPQAVLRRIQEYLQALPQAAGGAARATGPAGIPALRVAELEEGFSLVMPPGAVEVRVVSAPPVLRPGSAVFAVEVAHESGLRRRAWVRARLEAAEAGPAGPAGLPVAASATGVPWPAPAPAPVVAPPVAPGGVGLTPAAGSAALSPGPGGPAGLPVVLVARRGAIELEVAAWLLDDLPVGSAVRVWNPASGQVVQAVRVGPDRAVAVGAAGSGP